MTEAEPTIYEVINEFEAYASYSIMHGDPISMTEAIEVGYRILEDLDRHFPGEGVEYRDRVAAAIDSLCEKIEEETEVVEFN